MAQFKVELLSRYLSGWIEENHKRLNQKSQSPGSRFKLGTSLIQRKRDDQLTMNFSVINLFKFNKQTFTINYNINCVFTPHFKGVS